MEVGLGPCLSLHHLFPWCPLGPSQALDLSPPQPPSLGWRMCSVALMGAPAPHTPSFPPDTMLQPSPLLLLFLALHQTVVPFVPKDLLPLRTGQGNIHKEHLNNPCATIPPSQGLGLPSAWSDGFTSPRLRAVLSKITQKLPTVKFKD